MLRIPLKLKNKFCIIREVKIIHSQIISDKKRVLIFPANLNTVVSILITALLCKIFFLFMRQSPANSYLFYYIMLLL